MLAGDIEMMNNIAKKVAVLHDDGVGFDFEFEAKAALIALASGLHAELHHALTYSRLIVETGDVTDGIEHVSD